VLTVALIVMVLTGSTQANPVGGQVNSSVVEGSTIALYLDGNPDDYVTAVVIDFDPIDAYQVSDITSLLGRAGIGFGAPYNATIVMRCSGVGRSDVGDLLDPYINTFRNTTPTTAHVSAINDGNTWYASVMELESCATDETFSKDLYEGWNLISLPLTPSINSASSVLASVWESVTAVYRYNATSKKFEIADVMDPGTGYFVHVTSDGTWEYSGTPPYTLMDNIGLEQGLNMVGWLNCLKDVGDALSSISGKYHYVAQWNATAEKFEVYNPAAPDSSEFNDFTMMDRGTGYFISAKEGCTLSDIC
jgi:hypothetical protein